MTERSDIYYWQHPTVRISCSPPLKLETVSEGQKHIVISIGTQRTLPERMIQLFSALIHYYAHRTKLHPRAVFFYYQR